MRAGNIVQNENALCVCVAPRVVFVVTLIYSLLGPTSAPRAGSSRGPGVADPAAATRTSPLLMQSDKNKGLTVFNTCFWVVCWEYLLRLTHNLTFFREWRHRNDSCGSAERNFQRVFFVAFCFRRCPANRCVTALGTSGFFCFSSAGGKVRRPGSCVLPMIGECRWALRRFPYRHWVSSPPLTAAAAASPDTSGTVFHASRSS